MSASIIQLVKGSEAWYAYGCGTQTVPLERESQKG
jgi:hypothetical protein